MLELMGVVRGLAALGRLEYSYMGTQLGAHNQDRLHHEDTSKATGAGRKSVLDGDH